MLKDSIVVAVGNVSSRILGMIREILTIVIFGATATTDAYFVANLIPNFFRQILTENGFAQVFIPELKNNKQTQEKKSNFINQTFSWLVLITIITAGLIIICSPLLVKVYASGFSGEKFALAVELTHITTIFFVFVVINGFLNSILYERLNFLIPSISQLLLNIGTIATLVAFYTYTRSIYLLTFATLVGIIVNFLFSLYYVLKIHKLRLEIPRLTPEIKKLMIVGLPLIFAVSVSAMYSLITTQFASLLGDKVVSWFTYVDRLKLLPIAILATAIGTVVLPHISTHSDNIANLRKILEWGLAIVYKFSLPATIAITMLSVPILTTLFGYGSTNYADLKTMSIILQLSGGSILFISLAKVMMSCLIGQQKNKYVMYITVLNILLIFFSSWLLSDRFHITGLALVSIISALFIFVAYGIKLILIKNLRASKTFIATIVRSTIASIFMGGVLYLFDLNLDIWLARSLYDRVLYLTLIIGCGLFTYVLSLFIMGFRLKKMIFRL